ncbi:MAG TPA: hypothetical protein VG797_01870 [Phycisphaerales bacterium]|nr:hypothetical protein [Phycisphaerales bacterium]
MTKSIITWTCILVAALVVGPFAGWLTGSLRAVDGGPAATALLCDGSVVGMVKTLSAILLAGCMGVAAARITTARIGLFCAGLVLAWGAWQSGRLDEILRRAQSVSPLWTLAVEAAILGAITLLAGVAILKAGRADQHDRADSWKSPASAIGFVVALVVGGVIAALFARSEMVGQTFASAVMAGMIGATVGRVVRHTAPMASFIAAGCVLAIVGPAVGAAMSGGHVMVDLYAGKIFPLARIMPLDWMAGIFVGIPMGASWAGSMVELHEHGRVGV